MTNISTPQFVANCKGKSRLSKAALTLLMVMFTGMAFSQINYTRTSFTGAYVPITTGGGATQISTVGVGLGDFTTTGGIASGLEGAAHIPLPFDFNYNGTLFTNTTNFIGICTNGYIYPTVGATNATKIISNINTNLFTVTVPNSTIAPYFDDLTIGTAINGGTGTVLFQTTGGAGAQVMTIQWTNVPAFSSVGALPSSGPKMLNFQVKIYETTNVIEFVYGPVTNGSSGNTYNLSETASIGIESSVGGNTNYIDGITGSKTANTSMITSNKFPSLLHLRFTPGAPAAVGAGTYNVGVSQTYPSLSEAFADLNHRGISGAVALNLTDAVYDSTAAGGLNIFPLVTSNIVGTSAINTITVSKTGSPADLRYRGTDQGNLGNQASTAIIANNFEPILAVIGTDFMTVNNVNFTYNGVQGATSATVPPMVSYHTSGRVDCAIGLINSSSVDGATNNTFSNFVCTNDRLNPAVTQAIRHFTQTTPTSALGANGGNTYMNFTIQNGTSGIICSGNATFPDINNRIITSSCAIRNTIGNPAVANDLSNLTASTSPFGITMSNQSGFTISNTTISNLTNLNPTSNIMDGINVVTWLGTCTINNNIIKNIRQNTASTTASVISGIKMTNTTVGVMEMRLYNNSVSGLSTAFNGVATTTRVLRGISGLSTTNATATYTIFNNSVAIDGSASITGSSDCFGVANLAAASPIYNVRNNIFANYTTAQVTARHAAIATVSAIGLLGGTGSTYTTNALWCPNDAGVSGFLGFLFTVGPGNSTIAAFNAGYGAQAFANVSGDPGFFNIYGNLHATNSALLGGTGSVVPVYITTDLDCAPRSAPNHIGAYLVAACPSGTPTASISPAGPTCSLTQLLTASTSAAVPQYQWLLNGIEIFGATSSTYMPLTGGSYTVRINNTSESCFAVSAAVTVNTSPTITVSPTVAAVCDGFSVTMSGPSAPGTYPASNATTTGDEEILNVTVGTLNNSSVCGVLAPGPGSLLNAYGNFIGFVAPPNLAVGPTINVSIGIGTCGGVFASGTAVFIDYNQNGAFEIPAERVVANAVTVSGPHTVLGSFVVPGSATNGLTRMRVVNIEGGVGTSQTGNTTYGFGETEDYLVNIVNPLSYAWSPSTGVSSTTIINPVITPPYVGPTPTTTIYTLTVTDANGCTVSTSTSITNNGPADPAPTITGGPYTFCGAQAGVSVTATGLSTLNWYSAATGGTFLGTGSPFVTGPIATTTTIYVESFNGNCGSVRSPLLITINQLIPVTASATVTALCLGSSSTLSATSGTTLTYTQTFVGGAATLAQCTAWNTFTNSLVPAPYSSVKIFGDGGGGNPVAVAGRTVTNPVTAQAIAAALRTRAAEVDFPAADGVNNWRVGLACGSGCDGFVPATVELNADNLPGSDCACITPGWCVRPNLTGSNSGGINTATCTGPTQTVNVQFSSVVPLTSYSWAPAASLSCTSCANPIATPTVNTIYTVTTIDPNNGCTVTATVLITVSAVPAAPTATVNSVPCGNGNANLSAVGTGGTIKWWTAASGGTLIHTGGTAFNQPINSDTTFYVSETSLAAPFCEGTRAAVFVNEVDPDTISATVDIPLICSQAPGSVLVTLTASDVSSPQLNQYQYTWSQSTTNGNLNSFTGAVVTALPLATTTYTVTAQQIGGLTVNINGVSPNDTTTTQDSIAWTLKDASNTVILSSPVYTGINNNVTSGPVYSTNGPFTFQIYTSPTDTGFANFTVFCNGNSIASGCIKGALDTQQVSCPNTDTVTVSGLSGCLGNCIRTKTLTVGVGATPIVAPTMVITNLGCDSLNANLFANAASGAATSGPVTAIIGTGVLQNGTGSEPAPYGQNWGGQRHQMLIPASELSAAGLIAGNMTSLTFDLVSVSTQPLQNFEIQIGTTGLTTLAANAFQPTPFSVFGPTTHTPTVGLNTHTFTTPFFWDGSSNIIIQVCFFNPSGVCPTTSFTSNCVFNQTATPTYVSTIHFRADGSCSQCTNATTTAVFNQRPNMRIGGLGGASTPVVVSWSPATGLSSTTATNPTAHITASTVYTVTATETTSGCSATATLSINIPGSPAAPACVGASVCGQGLANMTATGSGGTVIWTSEATRGNIVASGNAYSPYVYATKSYGVREYPSLTSNFVGYDPTATPTAGVGFFPTTTQGMWFKVNDFNGMILNSVDIYTNTPVGTPFTFVIQDTTSGLLNNTVTTFATVSGVTTANNPYYFPGPFGPPFFKQTVVFNAYIPYSTKSYCIRPTTSPNLLVHQNATVQAGAPYQVAGIMQIMGYGNMPIVPTSPGTLFATNTFGFFYNWEVQSGCIGAACVATATVTAAPPLTITPSGATTFCGTGTVDLTAGGPGYVNYSWAPATGLNVTTGATVTASPSVTTTYTVTGDDGIIGGCIDTQTVVITANPAPFAALDPAPIDTLCLGIPFTFNASGGASSVKQIGFSTDPGTVIGAPFNGANLAQRDEMLFTAAELNAAGVVGPTSLTSIAFQVAAKLSTAPYTGFTVSLANQAAPLGCFAAGTVNYQTTGFTTCFSNNYTTTNGWNTINFTTPFSWDGVSNVIVQTCFTNASTAGNFFDLVFTTSTGVCNTMKFDNADACGDVSGLTSNVRPNVRFTGGTVLFSWSPATELNSATIEDPTYQSLFVGSKSYTVTVTDPATSCTATASINFVVSTTPKIPQVAFIGDSVFCNTGTANMIAFGTTGTFQWQVSTDSINFVNAACTSAPPCTTFSSGVINSFRYYRVFVSCGGDSSYSRILTVTVNDPSVTSTITDTVCGTGQVCLQAFANRPQYGIEWFAGPNGGVALAAGDTFCTNISSTTTFYAAANAGIAQGPGSGTVGTGTVQNSTSTEPSPYGQFWGGNRTQMLILGTELQAAGLSAGNLTSLTFQIPIAYTGASLKDFTISIGNTGLSALAANAFQPTPTQVYYSALYTPVLNNNLHTFTTPFPWDGISNIVINTCFINSSVCPTTSFTTNAIFNQTATAFTSCIWFRADGDCGVCGGATTTGTANQRPNMVIGGIASSTCYSSPRIAVVAVSTPPPPIALTPSSANSCEGSPVIIAVDSAGQANYQLFTWSPAAGLDVTTGATVIATPSVTTTYTVLAMDTIGGCAQTATSVITLTQRPTISSITVVPNPLCQGDSAQITVTAIPVIPPSGGYSVGSIAFAPVTPTGTPTVLASGGVAVTPLFGGSLDDGTWESMALPPGFAFNYYGATPTTFSVSTNGFMAFGALGGVNACCSGQLLPNVGTPNNYIAVAHEDLNFTTAPLGTLDFFTNGVAPFRKFVVRFTGVTRHIATGNVTAMIVLNETFNTIEMHLTSVTTTGGDFTTQAIENSTGSLFTVVPGRNSTVWNATNEGWLFAPPVSSSLTYSWTPPTGLSSTSVSNPKASPTASTTYTVTVFESGTGCSRTDSVTVTVTPKPKPYMLGPAGNILGDTVLCSNDPGFYIYVKDSGAYAGGYPPGTTFEFVGLTAPTNTDDSTFVSSSITETVIVTLPSGLGGCTDTAGVPTPANIDFGAQQAQQIALTADSVKCFGESTGNAIATIVFGGTPNFRWQWYDSSFNLLRDVTNNLLYDTLFGVPTGWYYFTSTDHQGVIDPPYCQVIDSVFVGEPAAPLQVDEVLANHVDVQCYGYGTGAIDITVSGGTPGYDYAWSNGSTDEDQSDLVAGVYTVTVTDQHGCTFEFATEIVQNPQVTIGTAQSNVSCHNGFDGTATVYVNGGVPGYTYLWSDGQTTETAFDLAAGTYTVIITDNSGSTLSPAGPSCDTIMTFLISEPSQLDATGTVVNLNCYGATNGVATANPFGGNPPYTYDWNSIPAQTTQTATGLPAGTIVCTITDSTGCTKDLVLQVDQPDSLYFDKTIDDVTCNSGSDGSITISVNGGTPGYTYLWSNGGTTETITGLTAGSYVITVTDANGCQVIASILVNQPSAINIVSSSVNVTCFGLSNGSALATVSGGTPPYSYSWNSNPAQTTNSATGLPAGTYTVVITDAVGCTASADVTITQPDAIALNENVTQPLCNGGNGTIELFITGGTLPYGIIWSNGNTTETNSPLAAGTYTVTVTDANGCVVTQTWTIEAPSAIVVTPTVTNVSCFGSVNGSIVVAVTGGVGPYTYQWSNGSTDFSISGLAAGNYTVTVTDANSCVVTLIVPVTQPAELTCICNSNITNVSCFGGSNGSITALPLGGTAPYSYSWIRIAPTVSGVLATTQTISGLTAGTYQVTITDANGCVKVGIAVVTQPSQIVATATVINNACSGNGNGQITLTVTGGVPPYTYAWNTVPPQTTSIATGLTAGSYTVIVTDANGCTKSVTATITQPTGITLTTSKNNVSCNGGANGTANVTATGGVTPYSYLWSNGKTTKNITGLAAGTYTATVTDANGCTKTATVTVTQPTKITALYVVTNPTCFGATNGAIDITVTGGTPPYTYLWNNGATTQDLTGIGAGAYSVFITDNKGCVILANIILTQPNVLALSTTVKDVSCFGGSNGKVTVLATGGTSPYTYLWSNGQTNAAATNLAAGTYTVTVTDTKGCSLSTSATVGQSPLLVCSANVLCMSNVSCFGGSNGKLCVSVTGGKAPYTYVWNTSPVATTASVNNVPAGTYTVVVTDKNGCTTSCTFTITQPAALVVGALTGTNVSCKNGSDGTASTTTVTGGTPPYTYLWNTGTAATTTSVSGLTAATYKVTVTDANGCTATATIKITQPSQVVLTATHTNLSCNGAGSGSITAIATGGVGGYTYTLTPGAISNGTGSFTGLAAGTYDVCVSDANLCSVCVLGIVITEPTALTMDATSGTDVNCFGGNNGTATAGAVSGGTPPYVYIWNTIPPQGTATATGLTAGTYIVMVTDAKGCTVSGTVVVNEPASPLAVAIINQTNITCSGGSTGDATADATGGTAPYTYLWSDGQTTATATALAAGTYVVTATDANGCQAITSVLISQANAFTVAATSTDVSCNGGANGTITATVTGGNPPITYTLNPGGITNGTGSFAGLTVGTYTVTAQDAGGCTSTVSVTITEPSILIANATSTNVSCNGGSNGTATVYATGGTSPYTYAWTGGSTLQHPTGLPAGTYTVTVTDGNGCTLERTVTITEPAALVITPSQVDVICNGGATGSATATVTGGTAPYFYMWSNGQMTQSAVGLTAGTYTVTVFDYKGCSASATYVITEGSAIVPNPAQGAILCFGGTTIISIAPSGGNAPYSYSWSQDAGNTTNSAIVGAGSYYVVISDASGCSITQSFTVSEPSQVLCGATSTNVTCNDISNGTASVSPSGGTGPYTYLWSNTSTDASLTGLGAGTLTVVVTDVNGCSSTCTVTITEPAALSLSLSTSNASCGTNNGSAMAIVSGGTAPYTYAWDDGETTASINNLAAGTYTVTVFDANGCGPQTASVTIGDTPPVSCSITGVDPTCAGYNNGSATVTVTGGAGSNTYSWNTAPLQTNATATGLAAGTYEVTVTDISGCSSTCSVEITEPSPLVLTASQSNNACSGGASGVATVFAFGGLPPYSYLWSNGQTVATATGLPAGAAYVTVTDNAGCSAVLCVIMSQPVIMSCNTSTTPAACGQAIGTATVNVFNGQAPFSYNWNTVPQQTNAIATNLVAGTYTVTVTDANGCSTQCSATVVQPGGVSYIITGVNPNCNGGTGSLTVSLLNGGTAPYTFNWSNGSTLASSGSVLAGTYTVTVTDSSGCANTQSATVVEPAALVVATTQTNVNCFGNVNGSACVSATGGTQPYSYSWSTGGNSQCISNLAAGTYTVTATDSKGCTSSAAVVITQPAILDTLLSSTTVASCGLNNGTATIVPTGGTAPYSYLWNTSPVQTSATATGLAPGNNFVTITDANGCSITVCVKVPSSAGIGLSLVSPVYAGGYNIRCNGGTDGSINLTVSGSGPFTYLWNDGTTTEDRTGLSAGTYTVTVTNGGCTAVGSITLTQAPAWTISTTQVNVTCFGGNNGSATVTANGGVAPYSYSWTTIPVQTTQTATGLAAGNYTVTVSDANGCTQTALVTLTQPLSGLNITATSVNPSCNGSSNGSIDITVTGGTPPYSYLWTGGAITEDRSGIPAGSHTVTVTDANGCTIALCVVLTQPTQIALTTSKTDVACSGGSTGSASVTAAGGTPPYTYLWNNGKTTAANNNIFAGTYTVTVTDANGCIRNATVTITSAAPIVLSTSKTNVTAFGGNDGTATVIVISGGTPAYAYSWNTVPVQTNATATALTAGTYQVTVTDSKGCVKTASVVITQPAYSCNQFRTETQTGWDITPSGSNAGVYLSNNFAAAFPASLVIGGGCGGSKTLTLTSATAVRAFLPNASGTPGSLSANLVNPTNVTYINPLAGEMVALKLNVTFDAYDPNFAATSSVNLGNMIYNQSPFAGLTVTQILNEANKKLGGCSSLYSAAQLRTACQLINQSWAGGIQGNSVLTCPAVPRLFDASGDDVVSVSDITAYPNPSAGVMNISFNAIQDGKVVVNLMDVTGRLVWNVEENVFIGENVRTYDFSQLRKGIYLMQVTKDGKTDIVRIVLQ